MGNLNNNISIEVPVELAPVIEGVLRHYRYATDKHPVFPDDLIKQAAIVAEEAGELLREANNNNSSLSRHECYQTAAVSLRMLLHIEKSDNICNETRLKSRREVYESQKLEPYH